MPRSPSCIRGFTLIELMVTVAIVAIIAAVAIPAYGEYVVRSRLPQAHNNLAMLRVKLEQHFQDNRSYEGACAAGSAAPLPAQDDFTYACPTLTGTTYLATATGRAGTPVAGFTFSIDHANARRSTALPQGWGAAPLNCWVTRKGGGC